MAVGDDNMSLFAKDKRDQWIGLFDRNFSPTRVLRGGTSTCLRITLTYCVQFELMDTPSRSTSKHNLSRWFGAMPTNVVSSSVYDMKCYFSPSLLKNTFKKKKTNNVNVYSIWFRFFFLCYSPRK